MNNGWIKLHRKVLKDVIWKNLPAEQRIVFITLLLMTNHSENEWLWNSKKFNCKPGQIVTSLESIQDAAGNGISIRNVRTAIKNLEKLKFLTNESTKTGRLITICKWDKYQFHEEGGRQSNRQRGDKDLTANKNNKNDEIRDIYDKFLEQTDDKTYHDFVKYLFGDNEHGIKFENCLSMNGQISPANFNTLTKVKGFPKELLKRKIEAMENTRDLKKNYSSFYLTLNNWCKHDRRT